jgi:hypothetical protein
LQIDGTVADPTENTAIEAVRFGGRRYILASVRFTAASYRRRRGHGEKQGCSSARDDTLSQDVMKHEVALTQARLKTPRAAAIAGIVFSVLLMTSLVLVRLSVPADPLEGGAWLSTRLDTVALALNMVPFAGIAFLWFIGVLRDRLGELEDRFFATVFFGSGLLFLAMLFVSAALVKAIIMAYGAQTKELLDAATFTVARSLSYEIMNIYAIKMAGVFMISLSTISVRTRITPRWIAILGYALALLILFGSRYISWTVLAFPLWVLLISVYILIDNWRPPRGAAAGAPITS